MLFLQIYPYEDHNWRRTELTLRQADNLKIIIKFWGDHGKFLNDVAIGSHVTIFAVKIGTYKGKLEVSATDDTRFKVYICTTFTLCCMLFCNTRITSSTQTTDFNHSILHSLQCSVAICSLYKND